MADAEVVQLGSRGPAGRGSRSRPSTAARGLSGHSPRRRPADRPARPVPDPVQDPTQDPTPCPIPDPAPDPVQGLAVPSEHGPGVPLIEDALADDRRDEEPVGDPRSGPAAGPARPSEPPRGRTPPSGPPRADRGRHTHPGGPESHRRPEPSALLAAVTEVVSTLLDALRQTPVEQLRAIAADPVRALAGLAETAGVDWEGGIDEVAAFARARLGGDYAIDEFGFDPEFTEKVFLPLLRPLVRSWFRVEVQGVENLPTGGPALLVSNHAGTLPLDGMVLHAVVHDEIGRHVRMLGADLIFSTPYSHDLARRIGCTLACQEDAERLLAAGELVSVFPEGFKGLGKPYADRYKLQRFGRGGFVAAAVRAQVPIVPISIVGSEEIYPLLSTVPTLSRALGLPYFPVTPLFPWFGLLGAVPLPSKWIIQIGEQIATDELPAGAADDPMVTFNVTDQVRETIQHSLYALLMQRPHPFW